MENSSWDKVVQRATIHYRGILEKIYDLFKDEKQLMESLYMMYPSLCVYNSFFDYVSTTLYIDEPIIYMNRDLLSQIHLNKYDIKQIAYNFYSETHLDLFINRFRYLLNSRTIDVFDIKRLSSYAGVRGVSLGGSILVDDDEISLHHKHDWYVKNECRIPLSDNTNMYWKMKSYTTKPYVPTVDDFESKSGDLCVLFLPDRLDWMNVIVFYKVYDDSELNEAIHNYQIDLNKLIDDKKNNLLTNWDEINSGLEQYGLKLYTCTYSEFPSLFKTLADAHNLIKSTKSDRVKNFEDYMFREMLT